MNKAWALCAVVVAGCMGDGTPVNQATGPITVMSFPSEVGWVTAVNIDRDGNVIAVGGQPGLGDRDVWVSKYTADGTQLWKTVSDGPMHAQDYGTAITSDPSDGSIIVTGSEHGRPDQGNGERLWLAKYDTNGNNLWTVRGGADFGYGVAVAKNGDIVVAGYKNNNPPLGWDGNDAWLGRYTAAGTQLWAHSYDGPAHLADSAGGIALDSSDNLVIAGYQSGVGSDWDGMVQKYDGSGNLVWTQTEINPGRDLNVGVAIHADDRIVVVGSQKTAADSRILVRQYKGNGSIDWSQTVDTVGDDAASGVAIRHNDIAVTGFVTNASGDHDIWLRRLDKSGTIAWTQTFDGTGTGNRDEAYGVTMDDTSNIYASGIDYGTPSAPGAQTWLSRFTTR